MADVDNKWSLFGLDLRRSGKGMLGVNRLFTIETLGCWSVLTPRFVLPKVVRRLCTGPTHRYVVQLLPMNKPLSRCCTLSGRRP